VLELLEDTHSLAILTVLAFLYNLDMCCFLNVHHALIVSTVLHQHYTLFTDSMIASQQECIPNEKLVDVIHNGMWLPKTMLNNIRSRCRQLLVHFLM